MRLRLTVLACAATALTMLAVPGTGTAHPHHNNGLTIAAAPNPVPAGDGVLIYGYLKSGARGRTILLYHHVAGRLPGYQFVQKTITGQGGLYEFRRAEGIVNTNRSWFVRLEGDSTVHSRTIYENVQALVDVTPSATSTETGHPVVFTGSVFPNHSGERVFLQQLTAAGNWRTLKSARIIASSYSIAHTWKRPGEFAVRVVFRGDRRNIAGSSDVQTVSVQQAEVADFTIGVSPGYVIKEGKSPTIKGFLYRPGTKSGEPGIPVTLYGHAFGGRFKPILTVLTGMDGSYSFKLKGGNAPSHSEVYRVRAKARSTALLFLGVQDVVTISASSTTATDGGSVTFTGSVSPDKTGHVIYLQKLGADGDWHTVVVGAVDSSSNYHFKWTFGTIGIKKFRVRIPGGSYNVGAASSVITIAVSGSVPPASLTPAT